MISSDGQGRHIVFPTRFLSRYNERKGTDFYGKKHDTPIAGR
jgi:hypothetical protein